MGISDKSQAEVERRSVMDVVLGDADEYVVSPHADVPQEMELTASCMRGLKGVRRFVQVRREVTDLDGAVDECSLHVTAAIGAIMIAAVVFVPVEAGATIQVADVLTFESGRGWIQLLGIPVHSRRKLRPS